MMNAVYDGGLDDIYIKRKKKEQVTPSSKYQCPSVGEDQEKRGERQRTPYK